MLKYVSKLENFELNNILQNCSLRPITFNNIPSIKITPKNIIVTCIKTDSILYKTILEWNDKQNDNGDLILSYIEKSDTENFTILSITDFDIKIVNNNINNIALLNENNKLSIKLNSVFLQSMLNRFENTNYSNELKKFNLLNNT